jgi:sugar lactone lactonase YvrE
VGGYGGTGTVGQPPNCTPVPGSTGGATSGPLPDSVSFLANVTVTTIAGGATPGATNGAAATATFSNPVGVVIDPSGALVVADFDNDLLRRITTDGTVSTLTAMTGFSRPYGLAYFDGTLYAETDARPDGRRDANTGSLWRIASGAPAVVAQDLGRPRAFARLSDGRWVLSDVSNNRVRLLDPATSAVRDLAGLAGCPGSATGTGVNARFVQPSGVVVLPGNRIIVADMGAHVLREVTTAGVVTAFAGDGVPGSIDGPREATRFNGPRALAADSSGAVFVSEVTGHRIRRVAGDGSVTTVAGDGMAGSADGAGATARFYGQEGIAVTANGATLYVADGTGGSDEPVPYHRIRKITIAP